MNPRRRCCRLVIFSPLPARDSRRSGCPFLALSKVGQLVAHGRVPAAPSRHVFAMQEIMHVLCRWRLMHGSQLSRPLRGISRALERSPVGRARLQTLTDCPDSGHRSSSGHGRRGTRPKQIGTDEEVGRLRHGICFSELRLTLLGVTSSEAGLNARRFRFLISRLSTVRRTRPSGFLRWIVPVHPSGNPGTRSSRGESGPGRRV